MKIGTIGAGEAAQAFAEKAIAAGHEILFSNSRGPESLADLTKALGPAASAGTPAEAARQDLVLFAPPWCKVEASLKGLPDWEGRILLDATNGLDDGALVDVGDDSTSEIVARLAAGARVVKALNASFMTNFREDPVSGDFRRAIFVSSDHRGAAMAVADLLESFDFTPGLSRLAPQGRTHAGGRRDARRTRRPPAVARPPRVPRVQRRDAGKSRAMTRRSPVRDGCLPDALRP